MKTNHVLDFSPSAVKALCNEIIEATSSASAERSRLLSRLTEMVNNQPYLNRKLVYLPTQNRSNRQRTLQAQDNQDMAAKLICELSVLTEEDKRWAVKMGILSETIYRHFVKVEERSGQAKQKLTSLSHLLNMAEEFLVKPKASQQKPITLRLIKSDECPTV